MTKLTKWSVNTANIQINLGIRPVWSEPSLFAQWVANGSVLLQTDSGDSDQTARMPRLIRVFAWRTCHFVGFVTWRLKLVSLAVSWIEAFAVGLFVPVKFDNFRKLIATSFELRQANLCLRAFRHDKFKLRMTSHSEVLGIWLSAWRFLLTYCLYERAAEVLARRARSLAWTFAARI